MKTIAIFILACGVGYAIYRKFFKKPSTTEIEQSWYDRINDQ